MMNLKLRWLWMFGLAVWPLAGMADPFAGLPDPTQPSGWSEGGGASYQGLQLQSTTVSVRQRRAMINGQRLGPGDQIQGATIMDIQPYQVVLQRGGREIILRLTPPLAKEKR